MKKYKDYSLQKKLVTALIICIIIPLAVIGIILNSYVGGNNRRKEYRLNQTVVNQLAGDVEEIFTSAADLKYYCLTDSSVQAVVKGKGNVNDYGTVGNWLNSLLRNEKCYHSICMTDEERTIIQRGEYLVREVPYENETIGAEEGVWIGPHQAERVTKQEYQNNDTVITYFCGINDYELLSRIVAWLTVNLKEDEISKVYGSYVNPGSLYTCMMSGSGEVISSTDKEMLGSMLPQQELLEQMYDEQGNGYVTAVDGGRKVVFFYAKSSSFDWYLVNAVPLSVFMADSRSSMAVILSSMMLCAIFGITFALIQRRYIIRPIRQLLVQIGQIKEGNFIQLQEDCPADEIGGLNREVNDMSQKLKNLIEEVFTAKIKEQEAELKVLISQINPHFFYNTLDSIHWMAIRNKDYAVADQLEALSEIFRHVLSRGSDMVTVKSEVEFLNHYMMLMQARFGRRIRIHIYLPEELNTHLIPKLIIQPLVENAILHGLEPKKEGGLIEVTVGRSPSALEIMVSDDGVGADEDQIRSRMNGHSDLQDTFALCNIDERIKLRYGNGYGLKFESRMGVGCRVTVTLPFEGEQT
ncbi:sensor histidine kinase [Lachnotalea sp. AF33-28]|uniref:sensor histidine kinase n=1 Tax=Lachnotalea sp. AF33-28 TaxID=2292046 RepID=UPI000E5511DD|nr:sensor histidine kinase [Lachnotalea sp. AF33-28]RHP30092.1 sensor histidine kinase [Lachnotalea sp. AF33-28]